MKKILLSLVALFMAAISFSQGTESFENNNAPGNGYNSTVDSYLGDNNLTWSYLGARNPAATYQITGKSIGFGSSGSRYVETTTDANGVGSVTFSMRSYFTGGDETNRTIQVLVGGAQVGSFTLTAMGAVETHTINDINVSGATSLRFESTGSRQVVIDNVSWTAASAGTTCSITVNSVSSVCNGDDAEFVVNYTASNGSGTYEVDIDGNGYQTLASGGTYTITGSTTAATGVTVTVRDAGDNSCMGTTTTDIPACPSTEPQVRINEIHYDNAGTDSGEFVEIFAAVPNGLTNPADYTILLVRDDGTTYDSKTLDATSFTTDIYGSYYVWGSPSSGIQNGSADGVALCGPSGIIQLWSYEGTLNGSGGCIDGIASTDMGASEPGDTPVGFSLQFFPTTADPVLRTNGIDGEWAVGPNTSGAVNNQSILPIELASISAEWLGVEKVSQIEWTTLSETNNDFFEVQHSVNGIDWAFAGKVMGNGTTDVAHDYNFTHSKAVNGVNYYRVKQVDFNGSFSFSEIVTVDAEGVDGLQIVSANRQAISITTSHAGAASYQVLNSMGRAIATAEFEAAKGNQAIYFNQELAHGFYIIQITINGERKTAKFVIH